MAPSIDSSPSKQSISDNSHHSLEDVDSHEVQPYQIHPVTSEHSITSHLSRTKSHHSELSRIISGIRDDHHLDEGMSNYKTFGDADYILANELDRVATNVVSRSHSVVDLESQIRQSTPNYKAASIASIDINEPCENEKSNVEDTGPKPDGGMAWVMAICAMFAMFATWGANAGFGVFLNFYLTSNTFPEATEYDYALIGGIVVCLANVLSPISALLYKVFGFKIVCFIGVIFQTAGWICASFATRIWHLYLTQGVCVGISFSLIFIPATLVLPTWFVKRKATSMGFCVSGAGLGGLIFSLSVNRVIQQTGDQKWALRMVGFVCLFTVLVCAVIMKPRNHTQPPLRECLRKEFIVENARVIFDLTVFKIRGIQIIAVWFAIALMGYTLMLFSLSSYAFSVGLSHSQGSVLTSVMNAAQIVGRPLMGLTADKVGRANFTSTICLVISILLYAFWINATTYGALIAFAVIIGLIIGVGSSLAQPLAADVLDPLMEKMPAAWSAINIFVASFCLVSEVIALALVTNGTKRPYLHTQIFAGTCFFACFLVMLLLRENLVKKLLKNRLEMTQNQVSKKTTTKSGYLKEESQSEKEAEQSTEIEDEDILQERMARYNHLLRNTFQAYFIRCVYPVKV